jgi:hypothetical protein
LSFFRMSFSFRRRWISVISACLDKKESSSPVFGWLSYSRREAAFSLNESSKITWPWGRLR